MHLHLLRIGTRMQKIVTIAIQTVDWVYVVKLKSRFSEVEWFFSEAR